MSAKRLTARAKRVFAEAPHFAALIRDRKLSIERAEEILMLQGVSREHAIANPLEANEKVVERHIAEILQGRGETVRTQVRCHAGTADIVTDTAIYEVKFLLRMAAIQRGVGQLLLYRAEINPHADCYLAGHWHADVERCIDTLERYRIGFLIYKMVEGKSDDDV